VTKTSSRQIQIVVSGEPDIESRDCAPIGTVAGSKLDCLTGRSLEIKVISKRLSALGAAGRSSCRTRLGLLAVREIGDH
jgi:hypothetical protein